MPRVGRETSGRSPDVTVVIPTKDGWELLPDTLRSALDQEDIDLEVIVVDDGSRDGTARRLAEWTDPRLAVRRHESSRGVAASRNDGIAEARGEWLAFLDHDDLWAPRKLREQIDAARDAGADFVYSPDVYVDRECRVLRFVAQPAPDRLRQELAVRNAILAGQSSVVARTDLVRRLGGFDAALLTLADWEMWLKLAWAGRAIACDNVHVAYRIQPGSMTTFDVDISPEVERMLAAHPPPQLDRASARTYPRRWRASAYRRTGRRAAAARQYLTSAVLERRPEMLVRGMAVLLGERAMRAGSPESRRVRRRDAEPAWLERYRPGAADREPVER